MNLQRPLSLLSLVSALAISGCAHEAPDFGPPSADDLADRGVAAIPAYAATITSQVFMCTTDSSGECDPSEEEGSATVTVTAAIDLSGADAVLLPCTAAGSGSKNSFGLDDERIQSVPSGAARAGVAGGTLDMQLAFPFGFELDDPFAAADGLKAPADWAVADHDDDNKPGMTFNPWVPGSIRFAARVVVEAVDIDPTQEYIQVDATLIDLNYLIVKDSIPFVNVANKVDEYLETHKKSGEETSLELVAIERATCADVAAAL